MNKSIFKNFIYNTIYSIINILYPLITLTYISQTIYASGVGRFSFCLSILTVFLSVAQLGIPKYGIREIAKNQNDKKKYSQTFWEIFSLNAISTTLIIGLYVVCLFNISTFKKYQDIFLVLLLLLIFNYFSVDWFFSGIEEFKYITVRSVCIKLISLLAVITFVRGPEDVLKYALIYCICLGGNNIINILYARKKVEKPGCKMNLKQHIKPVMILLAMNIAVDLYSQLDTTMLGILSTEASVGYYTNPMKFVRVLVTVVISLGTVLLPRLSLLYSENKLSEVKYYVEKVLNLVLFASLPFVFGIIACSKELVNVFLGSSFEASKETLVILALLIPILSLGNIFSFVLLTFNKDKKILIAVFCGAVTNLVLNYFFIIEYSQNGAAIASIIAELVVILIKIYYVINELRIGFSIKSFIKLLVINSIMFIVCVIVGDYLFVGYADIIRLTLKVCVGVISFVVFSIFIFKDENMLWILQYFFKKNKR